jgi:hypothetical protein
MASGPSERYSPHFSKSTFVPRAVDRFWVARGDDFVEQVGRLGAFVALDFVESEFADD